MIEHEVRIWREALDVAAKEADNFLFAEGNPRDVAARIRGLVPTPTVVPKYPLSEATKSLYAASESRITRDVNASNHLAGLDSHLVVTRTDLEQIRKLLANGKHTLGLRRVSKILDGEKGERALVAEPKSSRLCDTPSKLVGSCDLPMGHEGYMHSNSGDGFYAPDFEEQHRKAQRAAKKARSQRR